MLSAIDFLFQSTCFASAPAVCMSCQFSRSLCLAIHASFFVWSPWSANVDPPFAPKCTVLSSNFACMRLSFRLDCDISTFISFPCVFRGYATTYRFPPVSVGGGMSCLGTIMGRRRFERSTSRDASGSFTIAQYFRRRRLFRICAKSVCRTSHQLFSPAD